MEPPADEDKGNNDRLESIRTSKKLTLAIVFLALMVDNVLLSVVVPIIPMYLIRKTVPLNEKIIQTNDTENSVTWLTNRLNMTNSTSEPPPIYRNRLHNSRLGWLFASKALVQLAVNPLVGQVVNRLGCSRPMCAGFVVLTMTSLLYAFGETFTILFVARAVQGIGSSLISIAGMTVLAQTYREDEARSKAMGIALGGVALGVLVGYPFGGFMYEFVGKTPPFLVIATVATTEGVLQLWTVTPSPCKQEVLPSTPLLTLLVDPHVMIASGALLLPEMAIALLEPTLPLWLIENMQPHKWQLGMVFVPDSVGYWVACAIFGVVAQKLGRWRCMMASLVLSSVSLAFIPHVSSIPQLIAPHVGLGVAIGMVDTAVLPLLALLVEGRHAADYGNVYAIAQMSLSLAFSIGPSVGGQLVELIGFPWLVRGMAVLTIAYTPLCYLLRDPPMRSELLPILLDDTASSYTSSGDGRTQSEED
ncbi:Synaptic vesicular amine transporter [Lamellibrachia satsuma]|nr:Synaptic vesicular amine transporter [Lamellibrachia satsuma]